MGLEQTYVVNITCDNPKCKGHDDLDPHDRNGWIFMTSEIYGGGGTVNHVFGNTKCISQAAASIDSKFGSDPALTAPHPPRP
jgi:hypothetical protein